MRKLTLREILSIIENVTFYLSLAVTGIYVYKTYLGSNNLPPGVCPLENHRPWLYGGIVLIIVSFASAYFAKKAKD